MSRDWLLDQDCFVDEKATLCPWDLWELYYGFDLYSLVKFSIFLKKPQVGLVLELT